MEVFYRLPEGLLCVEYEEERLLGLELRPEPGRSTEAAAKRFEGRRPELGMQAEAEEIEGLRPEPRASAETGTKRMPGFEGGVRSRFSDRVCREVREYLAGERRTFDVECELRGTGFQRAVWEELRKIPYGETRTYGQIAEAIGRPKAGRAVGGACNRNPIWVIVPCHRVVGAGGTLTGYAGGLEMKQALLELEQRGEAPEQTDQALELHAKTPEQTDRAQKKR